MGVAKLSLPPKHFYAHFSVWENSGEKKDEQFGSVSQSCLIICVKEESEKVGLKLNIQKAKIMASGPITSWEIDGETVETVSDFIFWAPNSLQMVTAAMKLKDAYSLEGKLWQTYIAYSKAETSLCQQRSV